MFKHEGLVALSELPSLADLSPTAIQDQDLPPFVWSFRTPESLDLERLVLHTRSIGAIQRVAAIRSAIVSDYDGGQTTYTPGISGINADGSAIASKAGVKQSAPRSDTGVIPEQGIPRNLTDTYGMFTAQLKINKTELVSNIADKKSEGGKSREEIWADELTLALGDAYRRSSKATLLAPNRDRFLNSQRYFDYAIYGSIALLDSFSPNGITSYASFLAMMHFVNVASGAFVAKVQGIPPIEFIKQKRLSLFPSRHQSDRYIVLQAMTRTMPIISARK